MSREIKRSNAVRPRTCIEGELVEVANHLFGADAATAIAYCGIDAWFEGRDQDVERCVKLLKRLAH